MDETTQVAQPNVPSLNDEDVLDGILKFYIGIVRNGLLAVTPYAGYLVAILGIIDLATSWWLYDGELKFNILIQKALKISFLFFLIVNWHPLMQMIMRSFGYIGFLAGGHTPMESLKLATTGSDADKFLSPSKIIDLSFVVTDPLYKAITTSGSGIGSYILFAICWVMIKVGFIFIALQLLLTNIEFAVFTILSVVLLPFGCLKYTKFLSERCYSGIFTFGIKLMVVYFMLGLIGNMSSSMNAVVSDTSKSGITDATPKIMKAAMAYFTLGYLTWKLPNLISSMMSGQPNLGNDMTPGSMIRNTVGRGYRGLAAGAKGYSAVRAMWQATGAGAGAALAASVAGLADQSNKSDSANKPAQSKEKGASAPGGKGEDSGQNIATEAATPTSSGSVALPAINASTGGGDGGNAANTHSGSQPQADTSTAQAGQTASTTPQTPTQEGASHTESGSNDSQNTGEHFKGVTATAKDNAKAFAMGVAMVAGEAAKSYAVGRGFMTEEQAQAAQDKLKHGKYGLDNAKASLAATKEGFKITKDALGEVAHDLNRHVATQAQNYVKAHTSPTTYTQLARLGKFTAGVAGHTGRFAKLAASAILINSHLMQSYMEGGRINTVTLDSLNRMDYMRENHNYINPKGIASRSRLGAQLGEDSHPDM